jgi:hypothetical protein
MHVIGKVKPIENDENYDMFTVQLEYKSETASLTLNQ